MRNQVVRKIDDHDRVLSDREKQIVALESKLINASALKIAKSTLPPDYDTYLKESKKPKPPPLNLDFLRGPSINPADVERVIDQKQKQQKELEKKIAHLQRMINKELDRQKSEQLIFKDREKHLNDYLLLKKKLRGEFTEKDRYIIIEYEKDMLAYKKDMDAFEEAKRVHAKEKQKLNEKIAEKDRKIEQMVEKVSVLRREVKQAWDKVQVQERAIINLNKQNSEYRAQITEVNLRNKNLSADNKVVLTHLDKLLKEQNQNQARNAKSVFEERERRVIQALYSKNYSTPVKNPEEEELLPSYRNQLLNKVKYEGLYEEFRKYRSQKEHELTKLIKRVEQKEAECQAQAKMIDKLKNNHQNLTQINGKNKDNYKKSLQTIKRLQERIEILEEHIEYLRGQEEMKNRYYNNTKLFKFKTKIGSIVSKNPSNTFDSTHVQTH